MKTTLKIKIKPFTVPNFVNQVVPAGNKEDGWKPSKGIPLSSLSPEALDKLCREFTKEVFKKAGKSQPRYPVKAR